MSMEAGKILRHYLVDTLNEKYNVNVRILNDEVQTFNPEVFHECYHELAETICRHLEKFLATIVH